MRPGPPRGATATLSVTVEGRGVTGNRDGPATYATAPVAEDVEQVCRQLLVPHLEAGEVAVGVRLEFLHRAPVPRGEEVTLTAFAAEVAARRGQPGGVAGATGSSTTASLVRAVSPIGGAP